MHHIIRNDESLNKIREYIITNPERWEWDRNKIGMVSYDEEITIIIESQMIHNTQKSFFETMWDLLPEIKIQN